MQKFLGWISNPSHNSDNAGSLTCWATRELWKVFLKRNLGSGLRIWCGHSCGVGKLRFRLSLWPENFHMMCMQQKAKQNKKQTNKQKKHQKKKKSCNYLKRQIHFQILESKAQRGKWLVQSYTVCWRSNWNSWLPGQDTLDDLTITQGEPLAGLHLLRKGVPPKEEKHVSPGWVGGSPPSLNKQEAILPILWILLPRLQS